MKERKSRKGRKTEPWKWNAIIGANELSKMNQNNSTTIWMSLFPLFGPFFFVQSPYCEKVLWFILLVVMVIDSVITFWLFSFFGHQMFFKWSFVCVSSVGLHSTLDTFLLSSCTLQSEIFWKSVTIWCCRSIRVFQPYVWKKIWEWVLSYLSPHTLKCCRSVRKNQM